MSNTNIRNNSYDNIKAWIEYDSNVYIARHDRTIQSQRKKLGLLV